MSPEVISKYYPYITLNYEPFIVTNIHASTKNDYSIFVPGFSEFNDSREMKFFVYKFHNYFDGLIGWDLLEQLQAKIDLTDRLLKTPFAANNICVYSNNDSKHTNLYENIIPANSSKLLRLPTNIRTGDIVIKKQYICNCIVNDCVTKSMNNRCLVEVFNPTPHDIIFTLTQPVHAEVYNTTANNTVISGNSKLRTQQVLSGLRTDHLNQEEKANITKLCTEYADLFYVEGETLTFTNKTKHRIRTTDDNPVHAKSYRFPFVHKEEVRQQINSMLEQGIIQPSISAWSAPIWIVPKKADASNKVKWRLVVDFRKLNEKTIDDKYPIPNITDILDKLGKCQYFTTLDLASGFYQVQMHPDDIHKTGFTVENGHYEFLRMPMGLKNSPSTFQRVMDNILQGLQNVICIVYLDDILVFSTSLQEHITNLKIIFQRLRDSNFKIQMNKTEFLKRETPYLGHIICPDGIRPNPDKISAITKFPVPATAKQIKSFLGLLGYYRRFIPDFAKITKFMTACLKKGAKIRVTPDYIEQFEHCKTLLVNDPILVYPDFSKEFNLTTDASNFAIGAVLSQGPIGSDKAIAYASRTLNESELNYSTIEKELLAIVWATKYFRPYLFGRKFVIISDHKPLQWLMNVKEPNSRLTRWRLKLSEYNYTITYKQGKYNTNADALSRVEIHNDDVDSIIANASDTTPSIEELTPAETIHSSIENPIINIPITDHPINKFNKQLILRIVPKSTGKPTITKPFHNHTRVEVEITEENLQDDTIAAVTPLLNVKVQIAIMVIPANKMNSIATIIQNTFQNSSLNLIFSKYELENVTSATTQENITCKYHIGKTNHRGINECHQSLSQKYYWPKMKESISNIINLCIICKQAKYDRNPVRPQFQIVPPPSKPFEIVHMDVFTVEQKKYLTIVEAFSKYAQAYEIKDTTAQSVVKTALQYFTHHGVPLTVVTDRGTEFVNQVISEFFTLHKIQHQLTAPYAHNENGLVERFHSTLLEHLRILKLKHNHEHSQDLMPYAIIAYNSSIHSLTKCRPIDIITGHFDPRDISDINISEYLLQQYITEHKDRMASVYQIIHDTSEKERMELMTRRNQNREPVIQNAPGEEIFVQNPMAVRHKLAPRYTQDIVEKNLPIHIYTRKKKTPVAKSRLKRKPKRNTSLQDNSGNNAAMADGRSQDPTPTN